ncbi:hypothetical protein [Novosphingobium barchaimii]|uniref:hypothetical protein n=1 Tax=Novosphingobium barchaimii TaxID=1420591 RepID=UPI001F15D5C2|nr:hypothetical protein [Novosphingobium barchaimii]
MDDLAGTGASILHISGFLGIKARIRFVIVLLRLAAVMRCRTAGSSGHFPTASLVKVSQLPFEADGPFFLAVA